MGNVDKFERDMVKLQEKKQKELDRRGRRADDLMERSENASNQEQWEAYQKCVEHQHNKMIGLFNDIFSIQNMLEKLQVCLQGEH